MGRFRRYSSLFVSLTHMLKVKFIIHLVMHVMVKNNMLQSCWFHALIYIGLYRHLVNHTLDSYLPLDLYRSSFIMSNWQCGLKSWGFIKSLPWADIDPKWPSPFRMLHFRSESDLCFILTIYFDIFRPPNAILTRPLSLRSSWRGWYTNAAKIMLRKTP